MIYLQFKKCDLSYSGRHLRYAILSADLSLVLSSLVLLFLLVTLVTINNSTNFLLKVMFYKTLNNYLKKYLAFYNCFNILITHHLQVCFRDPVSSLRGFTQASDAPHWCPLCGRGAPHLLLHHLTQQKALSSNHMGSPGPHSGHDKTPVPCRATP